MTTRDLILSWLLHLTEFVLPMSFIGGVAILSWYYGGRYESARVLHVVRREPDEPRKGMAYEEVFGSDEQRVDREGEQTVTRVNGSR